MRELVNLTARRPFPAPPRRPFSRARRQINEVRYISLCLRTAARKRAYVFSTRCVSLSGPSSVQINFVLYIFSHRSFTNVCNIHINIYINLSYIYNAVVCTMLFTLFLSSLYVFGSRLAMLRSALYNRTLIKNGYGRWS